MLRYFRKKSIILDMILSSIVTPSWKNIIFSICVSALTIIYLDHLLATQKDQSRLDEYANDILARVKQSSFQISTSLTLANKSTVEPCSAQDMKVLREILVTYPYVEDIGRINKKNDVICTVLWGKLNPTIKLPDENINNLVYDRIWKLSDSILAPNQKRHAFSTGSAIAIASPATFFSIKRYDMKTGAILYGISNKHIYYIFHDLNSKNIQEIIAPSETRHPWIPSYKKNVQTKKCIPRYDFCIGALDTKVGIYDISLKELIVITIFSIFLGVFLAFSIQFFKSNRQSLLYRLKYALKQDQIYSLYQPKINLKTGRIVGVEALARWEDKELGNLSPDVFIACAEKNKIITLLTKQLFTKTIQQIAPFLKQDSRFFLSVNLSIQDLSDQSFLEFIEKETIKHRISPNQIIFEVTERSATESNILKKSTKRFIDKGYRISLDDFGTGFSNLSWLTTFEPNEIKVDKMFTQSIGTKSISAITLSGIFQLIGSIKSDVVFEGIETVEEVDYILEHCPNAIGQGWLYSKAVPSEQLKDLLESQPYTASEFLDSHR